MKVRLEDAGACRKIMHVEVPAEAIREGYDKVLKEFSQVARVPGFRQGRAPGPVVERQYAAAIADEARDRLLPGFYREAIGREKIDPVAVVDVSQAVLEKARGLFFTATVDLAPKVKLPRYRKIAVKSEKADVGSKDVDEALAHLLDGFARFQDAAPEREIQNGDLVKVDYQGRCEDKPVKECAPGAEGLGEGKDFWILVGEREFLPGFSAGLLTLKVGDSREIPVRFPADYSVVPIAGKDAVYRATVRQIREKVVPTLDEDLLKKLDVPTESALRERVRKELVESAERKEKAQQKDEIARYLLEKTDVDPPQSDVERETGVVARSMAQNIAMRGATREQIAERKDDILRAAQRSAVERVKLTYILRAIADEEKIVVNDSELEKPIEEMAAHRGESKERMRSELETSGGLDRLKIDLRSEKTLDFLIEHAKTK